MPSKALAYGECVILPFIQVGGNVYVLAIFLKISW